MQRHWYAIHTFSGHENKVATNILRRAETMNLREKVSRILVPTKPELKVRNGKKTEVNTKLYPGYVLIEMVLDENTWFLVKSTTGVTGFIPSGGRPVPLQDHEIRDIIEAVEGKAAAPVAKFDKGEVVRVVSGPFTEFTGKIEGVNAEKEKLKVLISIFGRDTPVELDFGQVEKVI
jgi:transcriptional antiterminator NusG